MVLGVFMFKKIYVEITNVCNLNCSFCIGNKRDKRFISIEEFSILLKKLEGFTKYLYFHVMGEPLIHPQINDLLDMTKNRFMVNVTTNGYKIDRIKNNKNIRQVNISLHSFDLKYGKNIDEYLDNIFDATDVLSLNGTIINYRIWTGSKYKNMLIDKLNKKYCVKIGDRKKVKLSDDVFFEIDEEFIWPSYDNDLWSEQGSCRGTRDHIGILVDGTVVPCCLDSQGIISLGNIYKQELNDIINGELFKEINEGFKNNIKLHSLCKKCNFYDKRSK